VSGIEQRPERDLVDDGSIHDDELLMRRIWRECISPNGRLLNIAFIDRRNEVSVYRSALATLADVMQGNPLMGCVDVPAALPRANEHGVTPDPLGDESRGAEAHAVIFPKPTHSRKRVKAHAERIAAGARWLRRPPPQSAL
jgi:hypothetical protein